jgi:(E)-4-hydroxy-3-methylbut-2-enyl-diphosphate synthase
LRVVVDESVWTTQSPLPVGTIPLVSLKNRHKIPQNQPCFCATKAEDLAVDLHLLQAEDVLVLQSSYDNKVQWFRWAFMVLKEHQKSNPVVFNLLSESSDLEQFQLEMGVFAGSLFVDGLGDGLWIQAPQQPKIEINKVAFGVLQATRLRISKTEYISCPSCGRTLFDLQETTAKIRDRTSHLKGLKIGIMGCIVNGPGEMADADYGYVGSGPGKITLYKEKEVVRKNVNTEDAVDSLIDLIKSHGDWIDPA